MKADTGATRARIVAAARTEFAAHGLAGARVDRISASASASKERLYAYFGDKESLFRAAVEDGFDRFQDTVPFTVDNLGLFAARAYRHLCSEPEEHRILLWALLQGDPNMHHGAKIGAIVAGHAAAVAQAQRDGTVETSIQAQDLMTLVFGIVSSWITTPGQSLPAGPAEIDRRCEVIEAAVRRLCAVT
ncbi:MAG: TetR family transcriptional regulator [Rhodococcus sp. (in: high G+C Gram-positive bacteria)]